MDTIVREINKKSIQFEVNSFIDNQFKIFSKYQTIDNFDLNIIDGKTFINNYDKYALHTIEEIAEATEELIKYQEETNLEFKFGFYNDLVEELVDILLYTGTSTAIIKNAYKKLNKESIFEPFVNHSILNKEVCTIFNSNKKINDKLLDILNIIVKNRRLFPERKWHKKFEQATHFEYIQRLRDIYLNNIDIINNLLEIFFIFLNVDIEVLNEKIIKKHNFILSLPLPKEED